MSQVIKLAVENKSEDTINTAKEKMQQAVEFMEGKKVLGVHIVVITDDGVDEFESSGFDRLKRIGLLMDYVYNLLSR